MCATFRRSTNYYRNTGAPLPTASGSSTTVRAFTVYNVADFFHSSISKSRIIKKKKRIIPNFQTVLGKLKKYTFIMHIVF